MKRIQPITTSIHLSKRDDDSHGDDGDDNDGSDESDEEEEEEEEEEGEHLHGPGNMPDI